MSVEQQDEARTVAERVLEMAAEVEASGDATFGGAALDQARAMLHRWIDEMTGVVVTPALGRVTIIHDKGIVSTISSPDLPFTMSKSAPTKAGE